MVGIELTGKIGEKGQVVIPKPLRDQFRLLPDSEVTFTLEDNKITLQRKENSQEVLEQFLTAIPKRKLPKHLDWDALYHSRLNE